MKLSIRIKPKGNEGAAEATHEVLAKSYDMRSVVSEIDKAIHAEKPLRLQLKDGTTLVIEDLRRDCEYVAIADTDAYDPS